MDVLDLVIASDPALAGERGNPTKGRCEGVARGNFRDCFTEFTLSEALRDSSLR
jgi:hypothetical protein